MVEFMNFLLEPENAAAVTNYAQYAAGITSVTEHLEDAVKNAPELNPPAGASGQFIMACPQEVQTVYDKVWTDLKK